MQRETITKELQETINAMKRIMNARARMLAESLSVSRSQLEVVATVHELQPVASSTLAKRLTLTPGAISQLVEGLVQLGYIARQASPDDRRTQLLHLTTQGTAKMLQIENTRHEVMKHVMDGLTTEELASYLDIQKKIVTAFENLPQTKDHA